MPEKLKRCVEHVKEQGQPESHAWPICVASTGQKPHKKKKKKDVKKSSPLEKAWHEYSAQRRKPAISPKARQPCSRCGDAPTQKDSGFCSECEKYLFSHGGHDPIQEEINAKGDMNKAWSEYIEKEWKPYKEWIKDKEEAKNAPKKKKPEKKDKPWKAKK